MDKGLESSEQVHYPQLKQEEASAPPPPPYATLTQPVPVQQTVIVTTTEQFGPYPKTMTCPHCGQLIQTSTRSEAGALTWVICCVLCIVGCDCGCCLIPFCMDSAQDVLHECPDCKNFLGAYRRFKC